MASATPGDREQASAACRRAPPGMRYAWPRDADGEGLPAGPAPPGSRFGWSRV